MSTQPTNRTIEQRSKAAGAEVWKAGFISQKQLIAIIASHFQDLGDGGDEMMTALQKILRDEICDNDGRGCPVIDELRATIARYHPTPKP